MVLAINIAAVQGLVTPAPNRREVKVIFAPQLHPQVTTFAAGVTVIPPGHRSSVHHHTNSEEVWLVVGGEGEARISEDTIRVTPDTLILIPRGAEHQVSNLGDVPMKVYWIFIPPGPEREILNGQLV